MWKKFISLRLLRPSIIPTPTIADDGTVRMAIHIKVAKTASEIDDALRLRHDVYVLEDGKFGGEPLPDRRMLDRYDAFPFVYNIVAYEDSEPIATLRLIRDSGQGTPADHLYDFSEYRNAPERELEARSVTDTAGAKPAKPMFGSAGMLAIRMGWRRRRDVLRALFRMAAAVCRANGATHLIVAVNHETASMYRRFSFVQLADKYWHEEIGTYLIPLASTVEGFHQWAFGDLPTTPLDQFKDSFERIVVRAGETIFFEGDTGNSAYIVDTGNVRVSRRGPAGGELTLTHLGHGDLFGELALVDNEPRSATVSAITDSELMTLDRDTFQRELSFHPERSQDLLKIFAGRIRRMDELALVLAFAPAGERLEFALEVARRRADEDRRRAGEFVFKGGVAELALLAAVDETMTINFLKMKAEKGKLEFSHKQIRFLPGSHL